MNFQKYDDIFNEINYPAFKVDYEVSGESKFVPMDDKPCVCLSGKKYEDCCKKDIDEALKNRKNVNNEFEQLYFQKDSKLVSNKVEKKSVDKKNISYCSAQKIFGNCDKVNFNTRSHTLSRGSVLKNLTDNGSDRVICFNDHKVIDINKIKNNIDEYYSDKSIDDASVTVSFCKKHDVELFADIETDGNKDYSQADIQNLEYALKAASFDVYYKIMNICYMAQLLKENKNVVYNDDGSYSAYFKNYYFTQKTLFEIYPLMLNIISEIKDLKEKNLEPKLKSVCFELPVYKVNFSCSEVIEIGQKYCFINVINSDKRYIIISYYEENPTINELKERFDNLNLNKREKIELLSELTIMLLTNAQNIYFNKTAFKKLSHEEKIYLYVVHREGTYNIPDECQDVNNRKLMEVLFPI